MIVLYIILLNSLLVGGTQNLCANDVWRWEQSYSHTKQKGQVIRPKPNLSSTISTIKKDRAQENRPCIPTKIPYRKPVRLEPQVCQTIDHTTLSQAFTSGGVHLSTRPPAPHIALPSIASAMPLPPKKYSLTQKASEQESILPHITRKHHAPSISMPKKSHKPSSHRKISSKKVLKTPSNSPPNSSNVQEEISSTSLPTPLDIAQNFIAKSEEEFQSTNMLFDTLVSSTQLEQALQCFRQYRPWLHDAALAINAVCNHIQSHNILLPASQYLAVRLLHRIMPSCLSDDTKVHYKESYSTGIAMSDGKMLHFTERFERTHNFTYKVDGRSSHYIIRHQHFQKNRSVRNAILQFQNNGISPPSEAKMHSASLKVVTAIIATLNADDFMAFHIHSENLHFTSQPLTSNDLNS